MSPKSDAINCNLSPFADDIERGADGDGRADGILGERPQGQVSWEHSWSQYSYLVTIMESCHIGRSNLSWSHAGHNCENYCMFLNPVCEV